MPEPQVWQWLVQLLLSLSYIHAKRILHRDVKTQNIFLSEGKVLLGDFGLAKQLQRTFEMARTPIGTPYYMCVGARGGADLEYNGSSAMSHQDVRIANGLELPTHICTACTVLHHRIWFMCSGGGGSS